MPVCTKCCVRDLRYKMGKIGGSQCSRIWAAWWKYNHKGCLEASAQIEICTREHREGASSASDGDVGNGQGKQLGLVCMTRARTAPFLPSWSGRLSAGHLFDSWRRSADWSLRALGGFVCILKWPYNDSTIWENQIMISLPILHAIVETVGDEELAPECLCVHIVQKHLNICCGYFYFNLRKHAQIGKHLWWNKQHRNMIRWVLDPFWMLLPGTSIRPN